MPELSFPRRLRGLSSETAAAFAAATPAELDAPVAIQLANIATAFELDLYYCALVDEENVTAVLTGAGSVADAGGQTGRRLRLHPQLGYHPILATRADAGDPQPGDITRRQSSADR